MSMEGAMLGGYLLPEEEFVSKFNDLLNTRADDILKTLKIMQRHMRAGRALEAFKTWDVFQTELLHNPKTELLAIVNFYNHKKAPQRWEFMNEADAVTPAGLINVQRVGDEAKKTYASDILAEHLSKMFKTVQKDLMDYQEICRAFEVKKKLKEVAILNQIKQTDKKYYYRKVVYGNIQGFYYSGKVADAYLNHIGGTHWSAFSNFLKRRDYSYLEHLRTSNVKEEEQKKGHLNFVNLLLNSLNNTAWYTGGDLIVTDPSTKEVIANIQLKTSGKDGSAIGHINYEVLQKEVDALIIEMKTNNANISHHFYNLLKTSAVSEQIGDKAIESIHEMAQEELSKKK